MFIEQIVLKSLIKYNNCYKYIKNFLFKVKNLNKYLKNLIKKKIIKNF